MNGIYSAIREGLDEYETFEELFGDVLVNGLTGDTAKEFLKEIGKELSEEDYRKVERIVTMFDEMALRLLE